MTNSHKLHCSVQCLLLLSETSIYRLVSLLGFSIHKGCQWKNCNGAAKESIAYQKWMRDSAPSQIRKKFRPQRARPLFPSTALVNVLCAFTFGATYKVCSNVELSCVRLGTWEERLLSWAVGHYHKLTFTLSLDGRSFHWHCFIMLFMVPFGWHCLCIEHYVGPVGNNHTHIPSTIIKWGENS